MDSCLGLPLKEELQFLSSFTKHAFQSSLLAHVRTISQYAMALKTKQTPAQGERYKTSSANPFHADEYVRGLCGLLLDCGRLNLYPPIWLVVATQIYLDIYDLLGTETSVGAESWLSAQAINSENVGCHRTFYNGHKQTSRIWDEGLNVLVQSSSISAERIAFVLGATKGTGVKSSKLRTIIAQASLNAMLEPVAAIVSLPVLASTMMFDLRAQAHINGLRLANSDTVILGLAHLYQASRLHGLITSDWPDMDFIVSQQVSEATIVPAPGMHADGYALVRNFQAALGVSKKKLAAGGLQELPTPTNVREKAQKLKPESHVLNTMIRQHKERSSDWVSYHKMVTILTSPQASGTRQGLASDSFPDKENAQNAYKRSTLVQLLTAFKERFIADETLLNFDYLEFHQLCTRVMNDIEATVRPLLSEKVSAKITESYELVDYILRNAAVPLAGRSTSPTLLLERAAQVVHVKITAEGNKASKKASQRSSGHVTEEVRPNILPTKALDENLVARRRAMEAMGMQFESDGPHSSIYWSQCDAITALAAITRLRDAGIKWRKTNFDWKTRPLKEVKLWLPFFKHGTAEEKLEQFSLFTQHVLSEW
jgi:hypothetical protein